MESPHDDNHVELQQVTVVTPESPSCYGNPSFAHEMDNHKGPPPYNGPGAGGGHVEAQGQGHMNGNVIHSTEISDSDTPRSRSTSPLPPEWFSSSNGVVNSNSRLSVNLDMRKRHKSEGALPTSSPGKSFLDPNNKKGSIYESKSTLSGVKFDDSFIGRYLCANLFLYFFDFLTIFLRLNFCTMIHLQHIIRLFPNLNIYSDWLKLDISGGTRNSMQ